MAPLFFGAVFGSPKVKWEHGKVCFPALLLCRSLVQFHLLLHDPQQQREPQGEKTGKTHRKYLSLVQGF